MKYNIKENIFYKLNKTKENIQIQSSILFKVIVSRTLFNLHKTFKFYKKLYNEAYGIEDEKVASLKDDLQNMSYEEIVKRQKNNSATIELFEKYTDEDFDAIHAATTIFILECFVLLFTIFYNPLLLFIFTGLTLLSVYNHYWIFENTKRNSKFGDAKHLKHISEMKKVEIFGIFVGVFVVLRLFFNFVIASLLHIEFISNIVNTSGGKIGFIIIIAGLFLMTFYAAIRLSNYEATKLQYQNNVEHRYRYVQSDEVWSPENSVDKRDKDKQHIILGYVDGDANVPFYLRYDNLATHHLILAGTGSGKSALVLLPMIIQFLGIDDTGIIVIDPKGDLIEDMRGLVLMYQRKDALMEEYYNKTKEEKINDLTDKIKNSSSIVKSYYVYQLYKLKKETFEPYIAKSKNIMIFDPKDIQCPYFNPLKGTNDQAQKMFTAILLAGDKEEYFDQMAKEVLTDTIRILKILEQVQFINDDISADTVNKVKLEFNNNSIFTKHIDYYLRNKNKGMLYNTMAKEVIEVYKKKGMPGMDIAETSLLGMEDYVKGTTDKYKHTSNLRSKIQNLVSNKYLNYIYNPSEYDQTIREELDFASSIANRDIIGITSRQDMLGDRYAKTLGLSLILVLQSTLLSVPINERKMTQVMIDEFQVFANDEMSILLNQGRSYKVCMHLATQTTKQIDNAGAAGLKDTVLGNTYTKTFFPGLNTEDERYLQMAAGEKEDTTFDVTKTKVNKETKIQDDDLMMEKKTVKKFVLNSEDMKQGKNQFGFSMSRYILVPRKAQPIRFAFTNEFLSKQDEAAYQKYKTEYEDLLLQNSQKYLASNLHSIIFEPTGFSEILSQANAETSESHGF